MEGIAGIAVIIFSIIVGLFIGIPLFFKCWDKYSAIKDRRAAEKYCDDNGLKFLKVVSMTTHSRLYFEKDGIESWANYETDKHYDISWSKETPHEKIDQMKKKETTNHNKS